MRKGDSVIMGVAPGWIFSGVVEGVTDDTVTLAPAAYIESVSAPWPRAAEDASKVTRSSTIRRLVVRVSALLWVSSCAESVARIGAAETIRKA